MNTNSVHLRWGGLALLTFLLELVALVALGAWGWQQDILPPVWRLLLALGGVFAFALVWGALLAPRAPVQLPTTVHRALKLVLFGLAALAAQQLWGPVPGGVFFGLAALTSLAAPARGAFR